MTNQILSMLWAMLGERFELEAGQCTCLTCKRLRILGESYQSRAEDLNSGRRQDDQPFAVLLAEDLESGILSRHWHSSVVPDCGCEGCRFAFNVLEEWGADERS